jgi:hypothetical protein
LTLSIAASYTYITTEACLTNVGIKRVDASSYSIGTGTLLFEDTANTLQTINLNIGLYGVAVYNAGPVLSQYAIIHATSAVAVKTVRTSVAAGQIQQGGLAVGDETCPIVGASASSDAYDAFLIRIWQIV